MQFKAIILERIDTIYLSWFCKLDIQCKSGTSLFGGLVENLPIVTTHIKCIMENDLSSQGDNLCVLDLLEYSWALLLQVFIPVLMSIYCKAGDVSCVALMLGLNWSIIHLVTFCTCLILFSCMTFMQNVGLLRLDKLGLQGNWHCWWQWAYMQATVSRYSAAIPLQYLRLFFTYNSFSKDWNGLLLVCHIGYLT